MRLRRLSRWKLVCVPVGLVAVAMVVYFGGHEVNSYMDSAAFCNRCHDTMGPQFITQQASPHSEVDCAACHVGSGLQNLVTSKIDAFKDVVATITGTYQRPIASPTRTRRPAADTCEQCHWPEKFTGDLVRIRTRYLPDEANTEIVDTRVLKVGGGEAEVAGGIHWHVTGGVWYVALDEQRLDIAWVGVEDDGGITEYIDPGRAILSPARIEKEKRLMDCVDCHNRVTHLFRSPEQLLDLAIADDRIDAGLPFIKREALAALDPPASDLDQAFLRMETIQDFYATSYPEIAAGSPEAIRQAVAELKEIARLTIFPEMAVDWNTHLDHSGHEPPPDGADADWTPIDSDGQTPGCFRCHGKLVAAVDESPVGLQVMLGLPLTEGAPWTGDGELRTTIDADCQLCHFGLASPPTTRLIPATPHPIGGLDDCVLCHGDDAPVPFTVEHPWSTNEACAACHQAAPLSDLRVEVSSSDPASPVPHPMEALEDCLSCHGEDSPRSLAEGHPWSNNDTCVACHRDQTEPATRPRPAPPSAANIPHVVAGLEDCLLCHGNDSPRSLSADHSWSGSDTCAVCHAEAPVPLPLPAATTPLAIVMGHSASGLANCRSCHDESARRPFPTDHSGWGNSLCSFCHEPAPPPPASFPVGIATAMPHSVAGLGDCLSCHGQTARLPFPGSHIGWSNSICTFCHTPSPPATTSLSAPIAPAVPHSTDGIGDCLVCHDAGGVRPFPGNHAGWGNGVCLVCHDPPPSSAPPPSTTPAISTIPHLTEGDCQQCHGLSGTNPFPGDHEGRDNTTCQVCHEPG